MKIPNFKKAVGLAAGFAVAAALPLSATAGADPVLANPGGGAVGSGSVKSYQNYTQGMRRSVSTPQGEQYKLEVIKNSASPTQHRLSPLDHEAYLDIEVRAQLENLLKSGQYKANLELGYMIGTTGSVAEDGADISIKGPTLKITGGLLPTKNRSFSLKPNDPGLTLNGGNNHSGTLSPNTSMNGKDNQGNSSQIDGKVNGGLNGNTSGQTNGGLNGSGNLGGNAGGNLGAELPVKIGGVLKPDINVGTSNGGSIGELSGEATPKLDGGLNAGGNGGLTGGGNLGQQLGGGNGGNIGNEIGGNVGSNSGVEKGGNLGLGGNLVQGGNDGISFTPKLPIDAGISGSDTLNGVNYEATLPEINASFKIHSGETKTVQVANIDITNPNFDLAINHILITSHNSGLTWVRPFVRLTVTAQSEFAQSYRSLQVENVDHRYFNGDTLI